MCNAYDFWGEKEAKITKHLGWSPLHIAANNNNSTMVATLLQYGADVNQTNRYRVMQSDGNSFCGDVVLDSVYMAIRAEEQI